MLELRPGRQLRCAVAVEEIAWIRARGKQVYARTLDGREFRDYERRIHELAERFPVLLRIERGMLVSPAAVVEFEGWAHDGWVRLCDGRRYSVARRRWHEVLARYSSWQQSPPAPTPAPPPL